MRVPSLPIKSAEYLGLSRKVFERQLLYDLAGSP
jgi:hypothetical protein